VMIPGPMTARKLRIVKRRMRARRPTAEAVLITVRSTEGTSSSNRAGA
jgi:hypothetical protein